MKQGMLLTFLWLALVTISGVSAEPTYRHQKSDAEWKKSLPPKSYQILRQSATEAPFTGQHLNEKRQGKYLCRGCGTLLFFSDTKYNSGCGWPSFFKPAGQKSVVERIDRSHNMVRKEILCSGCGGHLGHVFDDGPPPTKLRYCINSEAMEFRPAQASVKKP